MCSLEMPTRCVMAVASALLVAVATPVVVHAEPAAAARPQAATEPAPLLTVDAPLAGPLSKGAVVVPFHVEHMQIVPVYGAAAAQVTPRVGHLHLTLDHAPWHWVQASSDLIVLQGLPPGSHTLQVDLADATHQVVDSRTIEFTLGGR